MGTVVQVLEVVHRQDEKRVRGRIEEPAGWISIVSTEDGNRWAQRDLARSNRWAVNGQEQLQSLRRELQLLEAASKDAEEAQRMQELQTARETAEAERAEEMDRRERELREMQDRLRKTELQLHSAQVAADGPGVYVLQSDVDLSEGCQRNSKKVGRLSAGQEVQVLEVVLREAERRVRGRLSGGWISLLDTAEGYRWAQKQLFATNEWIGQLTANAGLTEMKARCAGLEATASAFFFVNHDKPLSQAYVDFSTPHSFAMFCSVVEADERKAPAGVRRTLCSSLPEGWEQLELRRFIEECMSEKLRAIDERLAALEMSPLDVELPVPRPQLCIQDKALAEPDLEDQSPRKEGRQCAEYKFNPSVWDSIVAVGLGVLTWQESLSVALCGLWSILVEGFFVLILYDNMTQTVFEDTLADEMKEWRMHFGQNINYVDMITGQPLIMGVCSMSNSLMNGNVQGEIYETMFKYGIREVGHPETSWPLLPVGAWLALIALLVWIFTVIKDMVITVSFGCALWSLPRGETQVLRRKGAMQLQSISSCRLVVMALLNILPRLSIALVLGIIGVHFLASTTSVSDLILNAVALEVVLCIDDLFFAVLVPRHVHEIVKSLKPIRVKLWKPWLLQARHMLIFLLSLGSLGICHFVFLQPVVDNMQHTADAMCSGITNFTFFQDAAGLVFILEGNSRIIPDQESYAYRAVLQATHLDPQLESPSALGARLQNSELLGLAMQLKSLDFEERNTFWPLCADMDSDVYQGFGLVHLGTAASANLRELLPIDSCQDARRFCFNGSLPLRTLWRLRALCPVTCGCASVQAGSFVANSPSFGCPAVCLAAFEKSLQQLGCADLAPHHAALRAYIGGLSERKGVFGNFSSCPDFQQPITIDGTEFNFCTQSMELKKMGFQSAQLLCPESCGCKGLSGSQCPQACTN
ncbi:unnamed protein product [Effrenium voratum]|nr:unnamed protein product [Effrenium voratum]